MHHIEWWETPYWVTNKKAWEKAIEEVMAITGDTLPTPPAPSSKPIIASPKLAGEFVSCEEHYIDGVLCRITKSPRSGKFRAETKRTYSGDLNTSQEVAEWLVRMVLPYETGLTQEECRSILAEYLQNHKTSWLRLRRPRPRGPIEVLE